MPYSITHTNPGSSPTGGVTIILDDNQVDNSTSLTLVGRGNTNYGQVLWTDFIKLLENFYGSSQPTNSIPGQLWYNSDTNTIYIKKPTSGAVTDSNLPADNGGQWSPLADHAYLASNYNTTTLVNSAVDGLVLRLNSSDPTVKSALLTLLTGTYLPIAGGTITGQLKVPQLVPGSQGNNDPDLTANQYLAVGWLNMKNYVINYVASELVSIKSRLLALESASTGGSTGGTGTTPSAGSAISGFENLSYGVGYDPSGSTTNYVRSVGSAATAKTATTQWINTNLSVPPIDLGDVDNTHDSYATPKSYVDGKITSGTLLASSTQVFTTTQTAARAIKLPEFPTTVLPGNAENKNVIYDQYAVTKKYVDVGLSAANLTAILSASTVFKNSLSGLSSGALAIPAIPTTNYSGKVLAINSAGSALEWIVSSSPITNTIGLSSSSYIKQSNNMVSVFGAVAASTLRRSANVFSNNIQPWEVTIIIPNNFALSVPYDVHATFTPNPATQSTTGFVGTMNCYITAMTATSFTLGIICNPAALTSDKIAYTINGLVTN